MFRIQSKSIRIALRWQIIATTIITIIGLVTTGVHGAISTTLGGLVSIFATAVAGMVVTLHKDSSVGGVLLAALKAEAIKIVLIVFLLWLVLAAYKSVVAVLFIGMFIVSLLISGMAFFVRDT